MFRRGPAPAHELEPYVRPGRPDVGSSPRRYARRRCRSRRSTPAVAPRIRHRVADRELGARSAGPGRRRQAGVRSRRHRSSDIGRDTDRCGAALSAGAPSRGSSASRDARTARAHCAGPGASTLNIRRRPRSRPRRRHEAPLLRRPALGRAPLERVRVGAAVVLRRQIRMPERQGVKGLVLDLRQNPGGCSTRRSPFVALPRPGDRRLTHGRPQPPDVYRAFPGTRPHLPLVVLVDTLTAKLGGGGSWPPCAARTTSGDDVGRTTLKRS